MSNKALSIAAEWIEDLRMSLLFPDEDGLFDDFGPSSTAHFLMSLSLIEQAKQHMVLAKLSMKRN